MPDGAYHSLDGVIPNGLLLVSNEAYFGPDEVIPNGLYVCIGRSKGFESEKDTWREAPHMVPQCMVDFRRAVGVAPKPWWVSINVLKLNMCDEINSVH